MKQIARLMIDQRVVGPAIGATLVAGLLLLGINIQLFDESFAEILRSPSTLFGIITTFISPFIAASISNYLVLRTRYQPLPPPGATH